MNDSLWVRLFDSWLLEFDKLFCKKGLVGCVEKGLVCVGIASVTGKSWVRIG